MPGGSTGIACAAGAAIMTVAVTPMSALRAFEFIVTPFGSLTARAVDASILGGRRRRGYGLGEVNAGAARKSHLGCAGRPDRPPLSDRWPVRPLAQRPPNGDRPNSPFLGEPSSSVAVLDLTQTRR